MELHQLQQDYKALELQLQDLNTKSNYQILVPVCGSNQVLIPGRIINTNAVLCQLAQDHFVRRTPDNCHHKSVTQRRQMADALLENHDRQIKDLQDKQNVLQQERSSETIQTAKGSVTRNAEGYLEIIEREDDVSRHSKAQSIEEVKSIAETEQPKDQITKPKSLVGEVVERDPPVRNAVVKCVPVIGRVPLVERMPAAERNPTTVAPTPTETIQKKSRFAQEFGR
ncbi:prefoldin subunit [Gregarina niphandrodes]|uniref:Prefoldin subunit n=1 Tax=Gregarina niphandrodes TaxID=110365 RepID=A0A023B4P7_GRENI|nr:prefoldin subunit [Gregarina niphandrodes]EZG57121.1 prefoldin subunit [Gregarina niphandrodes]|eukprot:XP_011131104.1 prefoldin subunit [Gregarina niphandrodes]